MNNRNSKGYDDLADEFEYGNMSDGEVVKICNSIINDSIEEEDSEILEAMYHAIFTAAMNRNISDKLLLDTIVEKVDIFNADVADYIISILVFTGKEDYVDVIKLIGARYPDLDIDEALRELEARRGK